MIVMQWNNYLKDHKNTCKQFNFDSKTAIAKHAQENNHNFELLRH